MPEFSVQMTIDVTVTAPTGPEARDKAVAIVRAAHLLADPVASIRRPHTVRESETLTSRRARADAEPAGSAPYGICTGCGRRRPVRRGNVIGSHAQVSPIGSAVFGTLCAGFGKAPLRILGADEHAGGGGVFPEWLARQD